MDEIEIRITQDGDWLATSPEVSLLHKLQEQIEAQGIGKDLGGGTGCGEMDILVEVADSEEATHRLRKLANEFGIADRTTIRVLPKASS